MAYDARDERRERDLTARRGRYLSRLIGKAADLIVAMSLWHIPDAAGACASLFYILMCDGFPGGRSAGKWLTGLKVVRIDRDAMDFPASMKRNFTVAVPFLLYLLPAIGPFLAWTVGAAILFVEAYLGFYDPEGQRAGDTVAGTLVVEFRQESDANPVSDRRA
ncbi:MAG: RDD family protein [Thermodesulfobacteriota bacterium]